MIATLDHYITELRANVTYASHTRYAKAHAYAPEICQLSDLFLSAHLCS
jgi:hypothetical protein